jgi:dTDP-4-dehydrorhamnose 3,5-epimerase-like enzyme
MTVDESFAPKIVPVDVVDGEYGSIGVLEGLPFVVRRVYYLFELDQSVVRGAHAHRSLWQLMVAGAGRFVITLDGRNGYEETFELDCPRSGLMIPPGYWREIVVSGDNALLLVLASEEFDESDYMRTRDEFEKWCLLASD